jgi:transcription elongation GreA/GreB family factor|tara:strand:- start:919 stop:1368 length:450 start_codon:yes stop_codon:yes gene_type:complete
MDLKQELYKVCKAFVQNKFETIEQTIQSNKNALNSETKSSAGDKHETGRAMLQLEMEKAGQQLKEVQEMQLQLHKIKLESNTTIVHMGSIVRTNSATYFIAISKGQIKFNNEQYFAISSQSPIGQLLLGKRVNDETVFRNQKIRIIEIL